MEKYILILHDLEDINFYGTEDESLFRKAEEADDLCAFVHEDGFIDELEDLGDDLTGITILGLTYGLQY